MQVKPSAIVIIFGLVIAVSGAHLVMAVRQDGWTLDAVAPIALALIFLVTLCSGLLYYFSRPVDGVDPSSREAWAIKARPLFKVLVPIGVVVNLLTLLGYLIMR